jgi:hypothetical protein
MHLSHLLGGGLLVAAFSWFVTSNGTSAPPAPPVPPQPPVAEGHYVLVVQGDRDQLTVTHANAKVDPWAGVPKGQRSDWLLRIHGGDGALLAEVPLDMSAFDLRPERKGGKIEVEGCIVNDPKVAMLVSVPRFVAATSYTFVRREPAGLVPLGTVTGDRVRDLAGGGK